MPLGMIVDITGKLLRRELVSQLTADAADRPAVL